MNTCFKNIFLQTKKYPQKFIFLNLGFIKLIGFNISIIHKYKLLRRFFLCVEIKNEEN